MATEKQELTPSQLITDVLVSGVQDIVKGLMEDNENRDAIDYTVAERCGVNVASIQRIMRGQQHHFSIDQLVNILDRLGIKVTVELG